MKLFELFEARKNPDLNPKLGPLQQLLKYKDDPGVYISMTQIPKLGINPQSPWKSTPNGVYTFKLSKLLDRDSLDIKRLLRILPEPFNSYTYVQVLRANASNTLDIDTYTESDYNRDVNTLIKLYPDSTDKIHEFQSDPKYHNPKYYSNRNAFPDNIDVNNPFIKIFGLTKTISKNTNSWNKVLRSLGYLIINDPGYGWISRYERFQTVFLVPSAYDHIDTLRNVDYDNKSKAGEIVKKSDIPAIIATAKRNNKRATKYEPLIMSSAAYAADYAIDVLGGRFPRYEKMILAKHDIWSAGNYYSKVIAPKRWPELEKLLHLHPMTYLIYAIKSGVRIKSIEPDVLKLANDSIDEYSGRCDIAQELVIYAKTVIKHKWPEAEPFIRTNEYEYERYLNSF